MNIKDRIPPGLAKILLFFFLILAMIYLGGRIAFYGGLPDFIIYLVTAATLIYLGADSWGY